MKIKPIPFNADMTKAIWEGRKTTTRRPVKGYALEHLEVDVDGSVIGVYQQDEGTVFPAVSFAPYQPGEIVYVPEAWRLLEMLDTPARRSRGAKVQFWDGEVMQFHFDDWERLKSGGNTWTSRRTIGNHRISCPERRPGYSFALRSSGRSGCRT